MSRANYHKINHLR